MVKPARRPGRLPVEVPENLIVEGWRFVPHSYAIVNQWQLLALARRDIRLKVVDAPFHRPWRTQAGLFDPPAEQRATIARDRPARRECRRHAQDLRSFQFLTIGLSGDRGFCNLGAAADPEASAGGPWTIRTNATEPTARAYQGHYAFAVVGRGILSSRFQ